MQYALDELRKLLGRDGASMRIGKLAHTEVSMKWATRQPPAADNIVLTLRHFDVSFGHVSSRTRKRG